MRKVTRSNEGVKSPVPKMLVLEKYEAKRYRGQAGTDPTERSLPPQKTGAPQWVRNPGFLSQVPIVQCIYWSVLIWPQRGPPRATPKLARHRITIPFLLMPLPLTPTGATPLPSPSEHRQSRLFFVPLPDSDS